MKCLVTICSKSKNPTEKPLPAHLRYIAPHIDQTYSKSIELKIPFYILSGKYGLISGDEVIPYYDYYLETEKVDELSKVVAEQIKAAGITDIDFYIERKESWKPYISALEKGAGDANCALHKENLFPTISEIKMK